MAEPGEPSGNAGEPQLDAPGDALPSTSLATRNSRPGNANAGARDDGPSTYQAAACPGEQENEQDAAKLEAMRRKGEGQYGCSHYRRRVRFITPCCNEEFWCRHCHNEVKYQQETDWKKKHELDRKQIREVVCALCNTRQLVGEHCANPECGASFGAYACTTCPFFDDNLSKKAYHCEECGICRIGGRENYFHCKTCASCYSVNLRGNHKCVDRAMHQNCPVCFEYLFESVDPTTVLRCGHTIHAQCLKDLEASQTGICPMCPICKKSLGDYTRYWCNIDQQIARSAMPHEYRGWRADILCNDCSESATIAFNIIALKCPACGSYNTRRMGLHTAAPAPGAGAGLDPIRTAAALAARRAAAPGAGAAGGVGAAPDALGLMAGLQLPPAGVLQLLLAAGNEILAGGEAAGGDGGEDEEGGVEGGGLEQDDEDADGDGGAGAVLGIEEEDDDDWETASNLSSKGGAEGGHGQVEEEEEEEGAAARLAERQWRQQQQQQQEQQQPPGPRQ